MLTLLSRLPNTSSVAGNQSLFVLTSSALPLLALVFARSRVTETLVADKAISDGLRT